MTGDGAIPSNYAGFPPSSKSHLRLNSINLQRFETIRCHSFKKNHQIELLGKIIQDRNTIYRTTKEKQRRLADSPGVEFLLMELFSGDLIRTKKTC